MTRTPADRTPGPRPRRPTTALPALALGLALAATALPALAQDTSIRFGRSLQLSGTQLEVTADQLEVDQATGASVFSGNVVAVQGELRLTAGNLRLESGPAAATGRQRVTRLVASGGVTVVTPEEAVEAQEAIYALDRGTLDMSGDVLLVQGTNVLSGQRFSADLNAGSGRISGRVRTVIQLD